MHNIYVEAFKFAKSPTMLDLDDPQAQSFADAYVKKCNQTGRLTQEFYDNAYEFASHPYKLAIADENKCKRFVMDYALSCHPASLITQSGYDQIYAFAHDVPMMNMDDEEAIRRFIYDFLFRCAKEDYLTQKNWDKVYNDAIEAGATDPEEFTKEFFRNCRPL